jgi:hypothetical protein
MDLYGITSTLHKQAATEIVYKLGPVELNDVKADEFSSFLKLLIKP